MSCTPLTTTETYTQTTLPIVRMTTLLLCIPMATELALMVSDDHIVGITPLTGVKLSDPEEEDITSS